MHGAMRLDLGCPVHCSDGSAGKLADIVIDPATRGVTHLIVEPHHRHDLARLVPLNLAHAAPAETGGLSLDCTIAELGQLEPVRTLAYLRLGERPADDPGSDIGIEDVSVPSDYQTFGLEGMGAGIEPLDFDPHVTLSYDRIPKGSVELRRESAVVSTEGAHLGHVIGLVLDPGGQIAHLVLEHGHLWGKRDVVIPIAAVTQIQTDEVMIGMSSDEVGKLKPVPKQ